MSKSCVYTILDPIEEMGSRYIQLAKQIGLALPLKSVTINPTKNENKNSILLCVNGLSKFSLGKSHEENLFNEFKSKGFDVKIAHSFNSQFGSFVGSPTIPQNWSEMIDLIASHEFIITCDNEFLSISNVIPNKKVIGIFGPSLPENFVEKNSARIIQLFDEDKNPRSRMKKQCACNDPKFCHYEYKRGDIPYCFENIDIQKLLNKIENLI